MRAEDLTHFWSARKSQSLYTYLATLKIHFLPLLLYIIGSKLLTYKAETLQRIVNTDLSNTDL